jgi:hypothetical protein
LKNTDKTGNFKPKLMDRAVLTIHRELLIKFYEFEGRNIKPQQILIFRYFISDFDL